MLVSSTAVFYHWGKRQNGALGRKVAALDGGWCRTERRLLLSLWSSKLLYPPAARQGRREQWQEQRAVGGRRGDERAVFRAGRGGGREGQQHLHLRGGCGVRLQDRLLGEAPGPGSGSSTSFNYYFGNNQPRSSLEILEHCCSGRMIVGNLYSWRYDQGLASLGSLVYP